MKKPAVVRRWLFVLATAAVTTSTAFAVNVQGPACLPGTFTSYESLRTGCTSGILQLLDFNLFIVNSDGQANTAPSSFTDTISVSPAFDPRTGTLTVVINGFDRYPVGASQTQAYEIDFTTDPPPVLGGEAAEFDPPFGTDIGSLFFCGDPFVGGDEGCSTSGSFGFDFSNGGSHPGSVTFNHLLLTLQTQATFQLNPNRSTASGIDGVVFSIFTTVDSPEPAAWLLMAGGVVFVTFRRKSPRG